METASTYFTRRARQERAKAADATSPEARKAHLELAFRLVRVATEPALWTVRLGCSPLAGEAAHCQTAVASTEIGNALNGAFPLPPLGTSKDLLGLIDEMERGETLVAKSVVRLLPARR